MQLPDLHSPQQFQNWYLQSETISTEDLLNGLSSYPEDIRFLRSTFIAYHRNAEQFDELINLSIDNCESILTQSYARALESFMLLNDYYANKAYGPFKNASQLTPMLELYLQLLLRETKTPLVREVECMVRLALSKAFEFQGHLEKAKQHASEALYQARRINAQITTNILVGNLVIIQASEAQISKNITTTTEQLKSINLDLNIFRSHTAFFTTVQAYSFAILGNSEESLKRFRTAIHLQGDSPFVNEIRIQLQVLEALLGIGDPREEIVTDFRTGTKDGTSWYLETMHRLTRVAGLSSTKRQQSLREQLLEECVDITQSITQKHPPRTPFMKAWILGLAYYLQGKRALSYAVMQDLEQESLQKEWLDIRLLLAGLKVELSMDLLLDHLPTQKYLDELKKVFQDASTLLHASPKGLAERLLRWHPKAAVLMSFLPNSGYPLNDAEKSVLTFTRGANTVHGYPFSPVLSCEMLIRSLDLGEGIGIESGHKNARTRKQLEQLSTFYGPNPYILPVVSSVQLIYALVKTQDIQNIELAKAIANDYGMVPMSIPETEMAARIHLILEATEKLLQDAYSSASIKQFSHTFRSFQ